jgi:hypothetical protein
MQHSMEWTFPDFLLKSRHTSMDIFVIACNHEISRLKSSGTLLWINKTGNGSIT